ncbi:hypothetical protein UFOVP964_29 [uncultured Caudovirales phage]|uniref:Uncharacterized protein n=1 Tax=uncultured Caudovirales phage TaxID=2100421 RepID=A0A6J5QEF8_9CAUD|nr:hypothetical protein UFOVP854_29 [uncultured Caudovirales phage]CAB4174151.1 hypothetical protein UFOVP964_29 [uncultured Caudovirales phage]CAB4179505.1 hypothetical protein UFOVP1034_129 [uncultured Caudovirales phage]CAB4189173.1 hypothetical protein UFOVP1177_129 [uncultured Caudovirales phage]CAB4193620.1 hypothetical protein UFOVP1243_116 [uncultured Caudovirales phage]
MTTEKEKLQAQASAYYPSFAGPTIAQQVQTAVKTAKAKEAAKTKKLKDNVAAAAVALTSASALLNLESHNLNTAALYLATLTKPSAEYTAGKAIVDALKASCAKLTADKVAADNKLKEAKAKLPVNYVPGSPGERAAANAVTNAVTTRPTSNTPGKFVFNVPTVLGNNFRGIQASDLGGEIIVPGNYSDALYDAFNSSSKVSRGSFQMDRQTNTAEAVAAATQASIASSTTAPDMTQYGFKFMYNPNTVAMSWGSIQQLDPVYEASGKDPIVPATSNLTSSNIDFSIVINRIQDVAFLDSNGLKKGVENPYGAFAKKAGVTDNEEFQKIYEKGTMYDLEYMFKTMHGNGAFISYESLLQKGVTSDPGWLPVRPIELHLGNKLRYRVRINSLSVSHTIFNNRMIPILSTVTISCARYWDGPKAGKSNLLNFTGK